MNMGGFANTFDSRDWKLMELLQNDGRLSFAELGRAIQLSAPAATERVRQLEQANVVLGYHARIDPAALGLKMLVFIEIQVKRIDYQRFRKAVSELSWILECHHIAGRAAFILKAAVPDSSGLELLIGHLSQFGDTATSLVLSSVIERREFSNVKLGRAASW
jgi:Lrp/AsnC family transcriptional regulator, leucine-responsive regulatory protein